VVSCSPIDVENLPSLKHVPYHFPVCLAKYKKIEEKCILFSGNPNWFRFQDSVDKLVPMLNEITCNLYIYGDITNGIKHPKIFYQYSPEGFYADTPSYSIQPLDYTSGIPSKSLESLSRGIPVLTTPKMKEICFKNHRHVYPYSNVEDINNFLKLDIRGRKGVANEIQEDMEKERGISSVLDAFKKLL